MLIDQLLKKFGYERKATNPRPAIRDGEPSLRVVRSGGMPPANWSTNDYQGRVTQGYEVNSDVYAAVSLVSSTASAVKWWDGTGSSGQTRQLNPRPSIRLLHRSGFGQFVSDWTTNMLLAGNAWIEIIRASDDGKPSELHLINPARIGVIRDQKAIRDADVVQAWRVHDPVSGRPPRELKPWRNGSGDIVHSKQFAPIDAVFGQAPLEAAMRQVDVSNGTLSLTRRVLQRGYAPGWIEARENSEWTDEHVAQLNERIRRSKYHGEELFLENAEWHPMGIDVGAAGLADMQILAKRNIASVFHVDPALIGDTSTRTYATYRESRQALIAEAVLPLLTQFQSDWNRTIGAELQSLLWFDRDSYDAISTHRAEAAERVTKLWTSGLITRDEARSDLEYDPARPSDAFYGPANLVPMEPEAEPQEDEP
jgi:HK97 family phage portal protein